MSFTPSTARAWASVLSRYNPGHLEEVVLTPRERGRHEFYYTTFCGEPHFGMRGQITVASAAAEEVAPPPQSTPTRYWTTPALAAHPKRVERGRWLFQRMGCFTCHGPNGSGGVPNWNYVNGTIPALNTFAERLFLFEPEDVEAVVNAIEAGVALADLIDDPPVPRFNAVLAQYDSVRKVISGGSQPGKKDPEGLAPPLQMPAWGQRLGPDDIRCLIAYLLRLQTWDEDEEILDETEPAAEEAGDGSSTDQGGER